MLDSCEADEDEDEEEEEEEDEEEGKEEEEVASAASLSLFFSIASARFCAIRWRCSSVSGRPFSILFCFLFCFSFKIFNIYLFLPKSQVKN